MLHSEIQGVHELNNGEGVTLEDLYQFLRKLPRKARQNYLTAVHDATGQQAEVTGFSFGQSDQAEKWEFSTHLRMGPWY